jgi:hypothetical protein
MSSKKIVFPLAVGVTFGALCLPETRVAIGRSDRGTRTCALRRKKRKKNPRGKDVVVMLKQEFIRRVLSEQTPLLVPAVLQAYSTVHRH